ncbi:MAG: hypothetical protein WC849_02815 [Candidatus Paceibacterota bacterium]
MFGEKLRLNKDAFLPGQLYIDFTDLDAVAIESKEGYKFEEVLWGIGSPESFKISGLNEIRLLKVPDGIYFGEAANNIEIYPKDLRCAFLGYRNMRSIICDSNFKKIPENWKDPNIKILFPNGIWYAKKLPIFYFICSMKFTSRFVEINERSDELIGENTFIAIAYNHIPSHFF